jgi:hypothetical protein
MLNFTLYILIAQTSGSANKPVDPGNDPLVTVLATVIFLVVSVGVGMLAFRFYNPPKSK